MIKKLFNALYADEDSGETIFNCSQMGILNIDLNSISPDDNFDEDDPDKIPSVS